MRKVFFLILKAAVSGLLLYLALKLVDLRTLANRFGQINIGWVVLAMLTLVAQTALVTVRWQLLISQCGAELSFARLFRIMMTAAFFNQTLPSSVGGDAMRIWLVGKQSNWRVATYSVVLDRAIGIAALAALVVICLPWTLQLIQDPVGRTALLVIGLGSLGGWFVFIALGWERLHILQRWMITRHLAATATIAAGIFRTPRSFVPILILSVLVHLLNAGLAWCVARSINVDLSLVYSLFLVLPVALVTVVPISIAGWGVREGAMVVAFGYAGLPQSDGLAVSILYGACFLSLGIVGGLVWIMGGSRA